MTGTALVLMAILFFELALRDGFAPLKTLGGAASGQYVLKAS